MTNKQVTLRAGGLVLPVCAACRDSVDALGQATVAPPVLYWAVQ
ncbi:MAG TPA: hypothetical protein VFX70_10485 [Mycobacteriales bacterium]|nr:hypothetical protein [Mycobacteriales bacterium]